MGWGDELIAAGQARKARQLTGKRSVIVDRFGIARWHEAWENNPDILQRSQAVPEDCNRISNGPNCRPYVQDKKDARWIWKDFECTPAQLYFSENELRFAYQNRNVQVVIEPNLKSRASPNKDWGLANWFRLLELMRRAGIRATQLGPAGTRVLKGAEFINTPTMRMACAVLSKARSAVLPEGGLHHAAAALGISSVVIYGGYISPAQTGYALHTNIFTGITPCGSRIECQHCKDAMLEITPEEVFEKLMDKLNAQ